MPDSSQEPLREIENPKETFETFVSPERAETGRAVKDPVFVAVVGQPGSGTRENLHLAAEKLSGTTQKVTDDFATYVPGFNERVLASPKTALIEAETSTKKLTALIEDRAVDKSFNVVKEYSDPKDVEENVEKFKQAGYRTELRVVAAPYAQANVSHLSELASSLEDKGTPGALPVLGPVELSARYSNTRNLAKRAEELNLVDKVEIVKPDGKVLYENELAKSGTGAQQVKKLDALDHLRRGQKVDGYIEEVSLRSDWDQLRERPGAKKLEELMGEQLPNTPEAAVLTFKKSRYTMADVRPQVASAPVAPASAVEHTETPTTNNPYAKRPSQNTEQRNGLADLRGLRAYRSDKKREEQRLLGGQTATNAQPAWIRNWIEKAREMRAETATAEATNTAAAGHVSNGGLKRPPTAAAVKDTGPITDQVPAGRNTQTTKETRMPNDLNESQTENVDASTPERPTKRLKTGEADAAVGTPNAEAAPTPIRNPYAKRPEPTTPEEIAQSEQKYMARAEQNMKERFIIEGSSRKVFPNDPKVKDPANQQLLHEDTVQQLKATDPTYREFSERKAERERAELAENGGGKPAARDSDDDSVSSELERAMVAAAEAAERRAGLPEAAPTPIRNPYAKRPEPTTPEEIAKKEQKYMTASEENLKQQLLDQRSGGRYLANGADPNDPEMKKFMHEQAVEHLKAVDPKYREFSERKVEREQAELAENANGRQSQQQPANEYDPGLREDDRNNSVGR
ncbi:MAG: zeta toxin family protein [Pseudomonadota bacterium]